MYKFIRTSGILIPRDLATERFYTDIRTHLTRTVRDYTGINLTTLFFFNEGPKFFKVPRYFPIQNYVNCEIEDKISDGDDIRVEANINLRDEVQENAVNFFMDNEYGIIQAPPGSGKTVMTILMISKRKKRSFILMHRDTLVSQWKDRILEYSDVKEDDVAVLNSKTFKEDLNKSIILATDQMFTSLLKRNSREFLVELNNANIGIFIGDEVHTSVGGPTFAQCSLNIPAKCCYGLSATPYRNDGQTDIIGYHLGNVYIPSGTPSTMNARVTILGVSFGIMNSKSRRYVMWNGDLNRARYLNLTAKSIMLEIVSKKLLEKFYADDRNILYVAERISLLEKMYNLMPGVNKSKFIRSAQNSELNYKAVFATIGKIRDGVDANHLDCLIMTSPVSNIEQLCGRILRLAPQKKEPIIVDVVDVDEPRISRTVWNRIKYYKLKNWPIQYIICAEGGKFNVIKEEEFKTVSK